MEPFELGDGAAARLVHVLSASAWILWMLAPMSCTSEGANPTPAAIQTPPDGRLALDAEIERDLSGGEALSFELDLVSSEYARLVAEASGSRIRVRILEPDGEPYRDLPLRTDGPTPVSVLARSKGVYRVEATALGKREDATGHLRLRLAERRAGNERDSRRIRAEVLFSEAEDLRREYRAEQSRRAIEKYDLAAREWLGLSDAGEAANARQRIGDVYVELGAFSNALDSYREGLDLAQSAGIVRSESELLSNMGVTNAVVGQPERAQEQCQKAMTLARRSAYLRGEAEAFLCLGEVHYHLGDLHSALQSYRQAQRLWQSLGDLRGQADILLYLGYSYSDSRDFEKALENYREALSFWTRLDDPRGRGLTFVALGRLYSRLGENQRALNFFNDAMKLISPTGDPVWEASISAGIGWIYSQMTEYQEALRYQRRSLELFRKAGYRVAEVDTLLDLGEMLLASGDSRAALNDFEEALSLCQELDNARCQSQSLTLIGTIYRSRGEPRTALDYYERALSTARADKDLRREALTLGDIGEIHERQSDRERAEDYYTRALTVSRSAKDHFGEAHWLYRLARVERDRERLVASRQYLEQALSKVESLRRGVEIQDLRSSYFASVHPYYELYIDVLMGLDRAHPDERLGAAAFQASERARARSFLEVLNEAQVDIRQGVDADLLARERALKRRLDEEADYQVALLSRGAAEEESRQIEEEIDQLTADYEQVEARIRSKSPRYAALTQPEPLSLEDVQRDVLDEDTVLLEYSLGEKNSYLWAVSKERYTSHLLPAGVEIERRAREVYKLLTARQPVEGESTREYRLRVKDAESRYWEAAGRLSEILLGPVAKEIEGKRLAIVSEGVLLYIPFSALPVPGPSGAGGDFVPLAAEHEITWLPSASLLAVSRKETAGRETAPKMVALFADPVFESDDPRLGAPSGERAAPEHASDLTRALRDFGFAKGGIFRVPRLPGTLQEAEAILSLVPEGSSMKATGFDANRSLAMSPVLSQYRIVHFATHGLMDSGHAELSGILLSMLDQNGRSENGFLRLHDIYNLDLRADLVVLSACNTALGEEIRGEGLVGLARGFMYSGARRVLASLWKVDDEATAVLMKRVYERMLRQDLSPAAALREAQVSMWREKQWSSPFYWSAFSLQGDWR